MYNLKFVWNFIPVENIYNILILYLSQKYLLVPNLNILGAGGGSTQHLAGERGGPEAEGKG